MEIDTVEIICGDETIKVDKRLFDVSEHFKELAELNQELKAPAGVTPQLIKTIVDFYKLDNFNKVHVDPVKSNDLRESIGEKHTEFLKNESVDVRGLFSAAIAVRAEDLIKACAAFYAVKVYFKNQDMEGYAKRKQELGVTTEITIEDSKAYANEFQEILGL